MNQSDKDKLKQAQSAVSAFLNNFGESDFYTNIVLEVLFEELYGQSKEAIPVSGEKKQERDETIEHFPLQRLPADQSYRLGESEAADPDEK